MPFIIIAFAIVILILALFVFSYVLIAALVIGLIVFIVGFIRTKFFGHKKNAFDKTFFSFEASFGNKPATTKKPTQLNEKTGRVIEHNQDDETR